MAAQPGKIPELRLVSLRYFILTWQQNVISLDAILDVSMQEKERRKLLIVTYMMTVLYALHYGIPLYVTSTYLHSYFSSSLVSMLYMFGSFVALLASVHITSSIKKIHTYPFTLILVLAEILSTIAFVLTKNAVLVGVLFVIHFALQTILYICLNIFVESFSKHSNTGSIRGIFLTLLNSGILISPFIAGLLLDKTSFTTLYIFAAATLIPFVYLLKKYMSHVKEPAYHKLDLLWALRKALNNRNLRGALIAILMVECFYAIVTIYLSLYIQTIGIPLSVYLSIIIPISLIPLVFLPYELGVLADTKYGEKEFLIGGLALLAVSVFTFVLIIQPNIIYWILVLFVARVAAACIETMSFSYYFKKINPEDSSLIALFSSTRPLATIIVGATGFAIAPYLVERPQLMFIILGCALLWSISYILPITDTR